MSPEVFQHKVFDARMADLWCLGLTLFVMSAGAPAYQQPSSKSNVLRYMMKQKTQSVFKAWHVLDKVAPEAIS